MRVLHSERHSLLSDLPCLTLYLSTSRSCKDAWADENNIIHGAKYKKAQDECVGPWSESLSSKDKQNRHNTGWNNQFALPWEVSAYWDFTGEIFIRRTEAKYLFQPREGSEGNWVPGTGHSV